MTKMSFFGGVISCRLAPNLGESMGGCFLPNASYPQQPNSTSSLPQAVPQMLNQEPVVQQPFPPLQQLPSELSQMPLQETRTPQTSSQSSQQAVSEVQRQFHQIEKVEQQLSSQVIVRRYYNDKWLFSTFVWGKLSIGLWENSWVIEGIGTHLGWSQLASSHKHVLTESCDSLHSMDLQAFIEMLVYLNKQSNHVWWSPKHGSSGSGTLSGDSLNWSFLTFPLLLSFGRVDIF